MSDFKAKMHQIRFQLGLRPRLRWGSLQRSLDPLFDLRGPLRGREGNRKGWEREGRGMGRGYSPKLQLLAPPLKNTTNKNTSQ